MPIYEKPTRELMHEFAAQKLKPGQVFSREDARRWFAGHYPKIAGKTVKMHVDGMSVNATNRRSRPTIKPGRGWDLFFKLSPSEFRLWDSEKDPAPCYKADFDAEIAKSAVASDDSKVSDTRPMWVVTGKFGELDYTSDFIQNGFWENKNKSRENYAGDVKTVQAGDRIILKKSSRRRNNIPFENNGYIVPVMAIDATGKVKENPNDGHKLRVEWDQHFQLPREWFFYDWNRHFWRVDLDREHGRKLLRFAFEGQNQEIDYFRNNSYWNERFGDASTRFAWTKFYEEFANKLLAFKDRRQELLKEINDIGFRVFQQPPLMDESKDSSKFPIEDFCPFSTIARLNRQIKDQNRVRIATEFANVLGISQPVPSSFEGIPVLSNQNSYFFAYQKFRNAGDFDRLWEIFERAMEFSDSDSDNLRSSFVTAFDEVAKVRNVKWNLSMGLYWIRPWEFLTLDLESRKYLSNKLAMPTDNVIVNGRINASRYLDLMNKLQTRFLDDDFPVHSFPDLSLAAYENRPVSKEQKELQVNNGETIEREEKKPSIEPYDIDSIFIDGCFIKKSRLEEICELLKVKKNLILQGPPGTGKTWLARRLAFALIGEKDPNKISALQFHPSLSYEDFIRGWRPSESGGLELVNGPFMEIVNTAKQDLDSKYVLVIEEINRGNPAQIFGEMLTLIEASKRIPEEGLKLTYSTSNDERVYVPDNLFIIGTMNLADRSLTLVDIALRRRFAFIDLKPELNKRWRRWVHENYQIDNDLLKDMKIRIEQLNNSISDDDSLGKQFKIGHSFFTPVQKPENPWKWFEEVVNTEIGPLLEEYWFDNKENYQKAMKGLLGKQ